MKPLARRPGASSVEYGLILALIAVFVLISVVGAGNKVRSMLCSIASTLGAVTSTGNFGCAGSSLPTWPYSASYLNAYTSTGSSWSYTLSPATAADGSNITYHLLSSSVGNIQFNPTTLTLSSPSVPAGAMQFTVIASDAAGTASAQFYNWAGSAGDTTPFGTLCSTESGTCSFSGTKRVTFYCPSLPSNPTLSQQATGSMTCSNAAFGTDPDPGCIKACAYQ